MRPPVEYGERRRPGAGEGVPDVEKRPPRLGDDRPQAAVGLEEGEGCVKSSTALDLHARVRDSGRLRACGSDTASLATCSSRTLHEAIRSGPPTTFVGSAPAAQRAVEAVNPA